MIEIANALIEAIIDIVGVAALAIGVVIILIIIRLQWIKRNNGLEEK